MKVSYWLALLVCTQLYSSSDTKSPIVWKEKMFIGLRAPSQSTCGAVKLNIKNTLPYAPDQIEVLGLRFDIEKPSTIYQKGYCLLSEFPQSGIKFDRPGSSDNQFYQICFVKKRTSPKPPWEFIPVSDIVDGVVVAPVNLCRRVSAPYEPLNLSKTFTTGQAIFFGTIIALVVGTGLAFLIYQYLKKEKDKRERALQKQLTGIAQERFAVVQDALDGDEERDFENQINAIKQTQDAQEKLYKINKLRLDVINDRRQKAQDDGSTQDDQNMGVPGDSSWEEPVNAQEQVDASTNGALSAIERLRDLGRAFGRTEATQAN